MVDNPRDPLLKGPRDPGRELFDQLRQCARGETTDAVIDAAAMLLLNCLRQRHDTRRECEAKYDELTGRLKSMLLDHYDSVTGRRKSVFAFTQYLFPNHFKDPDTVYSPSPGKHN